MAPLGHAVRHRWDQGRSALPRLWHSTTERCVLSFREINDAIESAGMPRRTNVEIVKQRPAVHRATVRLDGEVLGTSVSRDERDSLLNAVSEASVIYAQNPSLQRGA